MISVKHEAAFASLTSDFDDDRLKALRFIKNSVIGNKSKKKLYFAWGIVSKLGRLLLMEDPRYLQSRVEAAVILGSLAYGKEKCLENGKEISFAQSLANEGIISALLYCIKSTDHLALTEACCRSLKAILQADTISKDEVFKNGNIEKIITLLEPRHENKGEMMDLNTLFIPEMAALLIANCCDRKEHQDRIAAGNGLPSLLKLLASGYAKPQEAAMEALAALSKENPFISNLLIGSKLDNGEKAINIMLRVIKSNSPNMKLSALTCLVNMYRGCSEKEKFEDIALSVIPGLVKLFGESGPPGEKAPLVLAYLVAENEELQKAAGDVEAIPKLAEIISRRNNLTNPVSDKLFENALLATASICSLKEDCRKQVIQAKILPAVVDALTHPNVAIRAAACQCTKSLSRSVKNLRTSLVDAGVAMPLFKLLSDECTAVQITASATLCNIVLDFSPMKKTVLENDGIDRLVSLVNSMDTHLRLNAVWALKNLLFQADSEIKMKVMNGLTYSRLKELLADPDIEIQEQALNLLRNLACGKETDIVEVFNEMSEKELIDIVQEKLKSVHPEIILQALYVVVNISTGTERHKSAIIERPEIMSAILHYMSHEKATIRVATIWCVINLTWTDDKDSQQRVNHLQKLGFETKLKDMTEDPDLDVRDRVKTALNHFVPCP